MLWNKATILSHAGPCFRVLPEPYSARAAVRLLQTCLKVPPVIGAAGEPSRMAPGPYLEPLNS